MCDSVCVCVCMCSWQRLSWPQVIDLLARGGRSLGGLRVREDQLRGFYVEGLRRVPCDSAARVEQLMEQGTRTRTTAATHMNANSSRSHMLIIAQLKQVSLTGAGFELRVSSIPKVLLARQTVHLFHQSVCYTIIHSYVTQS